MPEARAHYGNAEIHLCTNFTTMVCKFKNEEVVIRKSARGDYLFMVVMEMLNTRAHQVSLPCISWLQV